MLAGHHPFAVVAPDGARDWPETREMIGMMFHRPLPSLEQQVGPEVWALIDRATQRKREDRFADMAAFAAALQQLRGPMAQTYAPTQRLNSADVAAGAASGLAYAGASGSGSAEGSGLDATAAMPPAMAAQLGAGTATSSAAVTRDPSPREPRRLSAGVVLGVFGAVALLTAGVVATVAGGSDEPASSAEPTASTETTATEAVEEPEPADPSEDVSAEPTEEEPPAAPTATASASAAAATPPATPARPTPRPVPVPRPQTKPPSGMDW